MIHSLLKRQLKQSGGNEKNPPTQSIWKDFLARVDQTYKTADEERYIVERSLMISSQEMHEVNEQLRESETRYAVAANGANDGLWDWDLVTEDTYYSERWLEILGIAADAVFTTGKELWLDKIHPRDRDRVLLEFEQHIDGSSEHFENEHRVMHTGGTYRWVLIRGLAVRDEDGKACRIAGSLTDITDRKRTEAKLEYDAVHDSLTGLPNRKKLMLRVNEALAKMREDSRFTFAVLFVDLDRFKTVNDSLGHRAGDELLIKFGEKLRTIVRPSDLVVRLGGDEFVILIEDLVENNQAIKIAQRLLVQLQRPVQISGHQI